MKINQKYLYWFVILILITCLIIAYSDNRTAKRRLQNAQLKQLDDSIELPITKEVQKIEIEEENKRYEIAKPLLDNLYNHFKINQERFNSDIDELLSELENICLDELINQSRESEEVLIILWRDSANLLIDKGQYTNEDLQILYEKLVKELDVKTKELLNLYNNLECKKI